MDTEFSFQMKMIENSGYPAELHTVVTEDNYILGLHRIPTRDPTPKIALLLHGLYCSAAEFIVTGRSSSLGEKTSKFHECSLFFHILLFYAIC